MRFKRGIEAIFEYMLICSIFIGLLLVVSQSLSLSQLTLSELLLQQNVPLVVDAIATTIHVCEMYGKCKLTTDVKLGSMYAEPIIIIGSTIETPRTLIICGGVVVRGKLIIVSGGEKLYCRTIPIGVDINVEEDVQCEEPSTETLSEVLDVFREYENKYGISFYKVCKTRGHVVAMLDSLYNEITIKIT